jgi:hypothetical protein
MGRQAPQARQTPATEEVPAEERRRRTEPPAPSVPGSLLALQRSAGNAAVSRLVASMPAAARGSGRSVSRFESGEHAQAGGARKININGVEFDEGDVIALGDFYETPEAMQKADKAELERLRGLIHQDREHFEGKAGVKAVENPDWSKATEGRPKDQQFLELAKRNDAHFSPRKTTTGPAGTDNKSKWEELHGQAVVKVVAHVAGGGKGVPEDALAINAFAGHFLTDAFSVGHIVHKDDVMAKARDMWDKQTDTSGTFFGESKFTKGVAKKVLGDAGVKKQLAGKELQLVAWGEVTEQRFSELIWQMKKKKPDQFFQAFARVVHDELNQSVKDPAKGIEVSNDRGDKWLLSGDATLGSSPKTLEMMRAAMEQSVRNLEMVAAEPKSPVMTEHFARVWGLTPRPTKTGEERLNKVVETLTDANKDEAIDAFANLAIAQMPTAISELTNEGFMRDKPAPAKPGSNPGALKPGEAKY